MIRIPQASDAYDREQFQQLLNAVTDLQKRLQALSEYVPQLDVTTNEHVKVQVNSGVVEAVNL